MSKVAQVPLASVNRYFEFSLLGMLTSGYLAVAGSGYLDWPTLTVVAFGLAARALSLAGVIRLSFSDRTMNAVTLAYVGFFPIDYHWLSRDFLTAIVHLVFFLAVAKLLTAKTERDYLYLKVIAFLELLAAALLSASLSYFAFLTLFLMFGVATFATSEIRGAVGRSEAVVRAGLPGFPRRLTSLSLTVVAGILLSTSGFFFLLPRTARAAFRHLVSQRYHLPGFSNSVNLGEIGEIKKRDTPVMHVRVYNYNQSAGLKWRGAALAHFDGRRWFNASNAGQVLPVEQGLLQLADLTQRRRQGQRIHYDVRLGNAVFDTLFFAGTPESLIIGAPLVIRTATDTYRLGFGAPEESQYSVYAFLPFDAHGTADDFGPLSPQARETYIKLPAVDPRLARLARDVTAYAVSDADRARAIERHLRTSYGYTMELPQQEEADPLAYFLFERRKGHCEYFASAMAVMLRYLGVPTRVATGFQTGLLNPLTGWHLVRASDAHSWVEVWLPESGWTTFDPTPPDPNPVSVGLWQRLLLYADAVETFWRDWVLDYDQERQVQLAARMESSGRRASLRWLEVVGDSVREFGSAAWTGLKSNAVWLMLLVVAVAAAWRFAPIVWQAIALRWSVRRVERGSAEASDATLLYARLLHFLHTRGFEKPVWLTPAEFARALAGSPYGAAAEEFTSAYYDLRFGGNRGAALRMVSLMEGIERRAAERASET